MLNDTFALELTANGIAYEREVKVIPGRRFAYDFMISKVCHYPVESLYEHKRLLVELQGGTWMKRSGHNSGAGIQRDCEKLNLAVLHKYDVMHFTTDDVEDGTAIRTVRQYLDLEEK